MTCYKIALFEDHFDSLFLYFNRRVETLFKGSYDYFWGRIVQIIFLKCRSTWSFLNQTHSVVKALQAGHSWKHCKLVTVKTPRDSRSIHNVHRIAVDGWSMFKGSLISQWRIVCHCCQSSADGGFLSLLSEFGREGLPRCFRFGPNGLDEGADTISQKKIHWTMFKSFQFGNGSTETTNPWVFYRWCTCLDVWL